MNSAEKEINIKAWKAKQLLLLFRSPIYELPINDEA